VLISRWNNFMINHLLPFDFSEQTNVLAGKLGGSIQAYQRDLQTGLVEVDIAGEVGQILLFVRGQLVTVYRGDEIFERLDPVVWLETLNGSSPGASLRMLALTPQDVRIFKILIEQKSDIRGDSVKGISLEKQFTDWMVHPVAAAVALASGLAPAPERDAPSNL